jgi:prepilin-type N-terminal cleavage/methylation domain-containing protein
MTHRSPRRRMHAFTLVELLVVITILGILIALLIPAISAAVRTARNASTTTDINGLATALNQFKSTYSDFPPSRVYLNEAGYYPTGATNVYLAANGTDITLGSLAQRSISSLKKFWPRVLFSSSGVVFPSGSTNFYDFNGNGDFDGGPIQGGFILQGHECLTFFLGGIPYNPNGGPTGMGMSGFGKNPTNPFSNMIAGAPMYRGAGAGSTQPMFDFKPSRLALDPNAPNLNLRYLNPVDPNLSPRIQYGYGIPGYIDTIGSTSPTTGGQINFYAYFSAYGGAYDPNDCNFPEVDLSGNSIALTTAVNFPCFPAGGGSATNLCASYSPNPYTSSSAAPNNGGTAVFQSPNTFQIISSGLNGVFGPGGRWTNSAQESLPFEGPAIDHTSDASIRQLENDNLSNFNNSKLGG